MSAASLGLGTTANFRLGLLHGCPGSRAAAPKHRGGLAARTGTWSRASDVLMAVTTMATVVPAATNANLRTARRPRQQDQARTTTSSLFKPAKMTRL